MNWKNIAAVTLVLVVGLGLLIKMATRLPEPPAHQVFINGEVLTMDAENRVVEAISIRGDLIDVLGNTEDVMASADDDTVVVDLRGRTLLPGFIDAHGHFPASAMNTIYADLNSPPIGTLNTSFTLLVSDTLFIVFAPQDPEGAAPESAPLGQTE